MKAKLHDTVLMRIVQIIQEAMLMGVDCVDIMRQVEVEYSSEENKLVLTEDYKKMVVDHHEKWLEEAEKLLKEQDQQESQNVSA
jgi:hypothetical protein